jgi:glucosamine-phosphate N-acetyltransferase
MSAPCRESIDLDLGEVTVSDLQHGFLEALAGLAPVELSPAQARKVLRRRSHSGIRTYVARLDGRVIGTASLILEQKLIHGGGWAGHIEDVAVHPEFRGHGIGSALVRHATAEARRLGCYKVILDCFEHLVPFYGHLGYHRENVGLRHDCH